MTHEATDRDEVMVGAPTPSNDEAGSRPMWHGLIFIPLNPDPPLIFV